ncbi:MAG: hypothetical protein KAH14_01780 [Clostridiales bacterium]|nr:hypothetical protein [Clostridiales bacterium]
MRKTNKKHSLKSQIIFIFTLLYLVVIFVSCSVPIEKRINQAKVNDFYIKAITASNKYGEEPVSGELRPVPASFKLTGKVLWIDIPIFSDIDPIIPAEAYENYSLADYSWYTSNASEVRYIILIDHYYSPSDENGSGNSLIFTIVDLSYDEMVYKSFIKGSGSFPYRELADFLENLTL